MSDYKKINVACTNERQFFRKYVSIMNFAFKLRNRDADVFAELLYHCHLKRDIPWEDRCKLVFDYDNKIAIAAYLEIGNSVLRNSLSQIRKRGLITNVIYINEKYMISPETNLLVFDLKINE